MASHKAPLTRVQAKRRARLQRRIALIPLFCLFAAFMLAVMVNGTMREAYGVNDAAPVARASVDDLESTSVSRSSARSEINHGTWESDDDIDPSRLGAIPAQTRSSTGWSTGATETRRRMASTRIMRTGTRATPTRSANAPGGRTSDATN